MPTWALVLIGLVAFQDSQPQEPGKPVPKDSVRIATAGCLKGRVFLATGQREQEGSPVSGPDVTGKSFRLNGPREVMADVKTHNGHYVEVVGLVRKSDVGSNGVGTKIGNTRVVIGAPRGGDPMGSMRQPQGGVPVMDVTSVNYLADRCPIDVR